MDHITRREFLKISAGAAAVFGGSPLLIGCDKNSGTNPTNGNRVSVAAIRGTDLYQMTRDALDAIGGIKKIVNPGESVFLKPNMVTIPWGQNGRTFLNGECTKPEILITVAEECLKAGASEAIIGDGSQVITFDWKYAVTLACLENDSPEFIYVPSRTYLNQISISSLVKNADRVISIPVAKTHSWAQLTLALKNFIGVTSIERYGVWLDSHWNRGKGLDHSSPQAIGQIYLDVVEALKPDLTVIDFSIGIEGNGPTTDSGGTTLDMKNRLGILACSRQHRHHGC